MMSAGGHWVKVIMGVVDAGYDDMPLQIDVTRLGIGQRSDLSGGANREDVFAPDSDCFDVSLRRVSGEDFAIEQD